MSKELHIAGYQGGGSILTQALATLARHLRDAGLGIPGFVDDVTAAGESAASLFASLESGERHIGYMASGYLSGRVTELAVLDLPFSVNDRTTALKALDGHAGELLREAVSRRSGYHVLAFWDNGFRHISNARRPLRSPSDCAGLVIRTLDSALYRETLQALGFTAVTTDVKDLVRVARDGIVQAQENPLTNFVNFGLWQYHPHVSLTGHFFGVLLLVCPRSWQERLSASQRAALQTAVKIATTQQRAAAAAQDHAARMCLEESGGVQIIERERLDLEAMREATASVRQSHLDRLPTDLIRAYLEPEPVGQAVT